MESSDYNSRSFTSHDKFITKPRDYKSKWKSSNNLENLLPNDYNVNPRIIHPIKSLKSEKYCPVESLNEDFHSSKNLPSTFTFGHKFDVLSNNIRFNSINDEPIVKETLDQENKLKESLHLYAHHIKKNDGASVNTLNKVRSVLLTWLKDSEQDNLEYNKFMTEKKIKYIMKNKEKSELKIKNLEVELISFKNRKPELEFLLQDEYLNYEVDELTQDIERFANSWEIKNGKSKKMIEKLQEMKVKLPLVQEFNSIKEQEQTKLNEKKELKKIIQGSTQTLGFLSNYYKNLKKKIHENILKNEKPLHKLT